MSRRDYLVKSELNLWDCWKRRQPCVWADYEEKDAIQLTSDHFLELKLHPNPATDHTIIEVPKDPSENWSVQVFSMSGELIKLQHFENVTSGRMDLTGMAPQVYLLKVYSGGMNFGCLRMVVTTG